MNQNLLKILILFFFLSGVDISAQDFTWKKGSTSNSQTGIYGSQGVGAAGNNPGARRLACTWKDVTGNFWLFGGEGHDFIGNYDFLNDLWKYDVGTNQWTWIKGDNIIAQVGVYGTMGVSAATNKPGSRAGSVSWTDAGGNFWMFGGYGYGSSSSLGYLNDLWKYNVSNNQWTWMSGSNLVNQTGNYGTVMVTTGSNMPGARIVPTSWMDQSGNFYLFGGEGYGSASTVGQMNDLWKFEPATNMWTWIKGSNALNQNGVYGTIGVAAAANAPGARYSGHGWADPSGNFWMMGGNGFGATNSGYLNDLWKYSISNNEWTWIKGSNNVDMNGVYGVQVVSTPTNFPGGRYGGLTWIDATGALWLHGGEGFPATGTTVGHLNDLWRYEISINTWTWVKGSSIINQPGFYGSIGIAAMTNRPGGRVGASSWIDNSNNLYLFGGEGYGANTSTGPNELNDLWKYTNCYINPVSMTITSQAPEICKGEKTTLTATGSNNYVWSHNSETATSVTVAPSSTTTYSVHSSNSNGCVYTAAFTQNVSECVSILNNKTGATLKFYPNPNKGEFMIECESAATHLVIFDALGKEVFVKDLHVNLNHITTKLSPGIYLYKATTEAGKAINGKIVIQQ